MKFAKTLPSNLIFFKTRSYLPQMEQNQFTNPVLRKGKTWHVEYYFNGTRYRLSDGINRIKDVKQKENEANALLIAITNHLNNGYNPEATQEYLEKISLDNISLEDAIQKFLEYHKKYGSRKKTIQSYASKLKYLSIHFKGKTVKDITTAKLEDYFFYKINTSETIVIVDKNGKERKYLTVKWSQKTVKGAKGVFVPFFNWCIEKKYINENPFKNFNKKIKSSKETDEKHVPFSEIDAKQIMEHVDVADKLGALFCRFIYATCLRPAELRGIQLKHINLQSKTLVVPMAVMKNTKAQKDDLVDLDDNLIEELKKIEISNHPKEYYLFSNSKTIFGEKRIGENTPYNKLISVLTKLNLLDKGYDLYSFKHYSNIVRLNSDWTLAQIMKRNRHTSVSTTEIYLRMLTKTTTISHLRIPSI